MALNLKKYFYDPRTGLFSADKVYKKLRSEGYSITLKEVKEQLANQYTNQINKVVRKPTEFNSIYAPNNKDNYQMDIIVYDRYSFHNYKYILVCIDVHSRYLSVRAMTSREMTTIIKNVKDIFTEMGSPKNLNCDNEFNKNEFNELMIKLNVKTHYSDPNEINKNAIVERVNRTLAGLLQKYRVASKKYDWYKVLPDIVYNYNHTEHRTMKATPADVWENKDVSSQVIIKVKKKLKVGDQVRIKNKKKVFDKGDIITHSKEVYVVAEILGNKYKLKDEKGALVKQLYKQYELSKVNSIQYHEAPQEDHEIQHKKTQSERRFTRSMNKERIEPNTESIRRNLRERKPNQLVSDEYGKVIW